MFSRVRWRLRYVGCGENSQFGLTALMWAAQKGYTDCARLLIDAGAKNPRNKNGHTAIDVAQHNGKADIVALLSA